MHLEIQIIVPDDQASRMRSALDLDIETATRICDAKHIVKPSRCTRSNHQYPSYQSTCSYQSKCFHLVMVLQKQGDDSPLRLA
jgi:hypothetical protein